VNRIAGRLLPAVAIVAFTAGACAMTKPVPTPTRVPATPTAASPTPEPSSTPAAINIDWWHSNSTDPAKTIWQTAARMYESEHPWVSIKIQAVDTNALQANLTTATQANDLPDLFESSGGADFIAQAKAGLLKDITAAVATWSGPAAQDINGLNVYSYRGSQYGVPWGMGLTGFFYNRALFSRAGISTTPASWVDLLSDVDKLRAVGIVPLALGGRDEWPGMNLWTYLVMREGGSHALTQMIQNGDWNTDGCVAAGTDLAALVAKNPFQPGFLSAVYDRGEAAAMGNGQAAMEVMGEWAAAVQQTSSTSGQGIGGDLSWFAFPAVASGMGQPTDGLGSANGIAVGKNAPPEAVDFLHFLMSTKIMDEIGAAGMALPTTTGSSGSVRDPILAQIVSARNRAQSMQLYLNQVTSPDLTAAIEDATAALIAGRTTPQQVCQAITTAAAKG
jgi:raffinose/stachyose/melibiose transport system substrate-binding protein